MSDEDIKRLNNTLEEISAIADKANKVFGFVKYVVWLVVGLGSLAIGSGVWVYATNTNIHDAQKEINLVKAEQREIELWRKSVDENNIRVTITMEKVTELLKLHIQDTAKNKQVQAANNP